MITIRVGELAKALGVHRNTIRNWINSGVLEARPTTAKKYEIPADAFLRFIEAQGISPASVKKWIESDPQISASQRIQAFSQPTVKKGAFMAKNPVGAVMVVGGGIAGIQATLDLADSGYYVYLLEKSPGIGGVMAKLDKTFPTNDCAM
jgi:excisionase family DNA binding protein